MLKLRVLVLESICAVLTAMTVTSAARADDVREYVAAAFNAQQTAFPRKVAVSYKLGASTFSFETIQEDRSRIHLKTTSPNGVQGEFIWIGTQVFTKSGGNWRLTDGPIGFPKERVPTDDLKRLVPNLTEQPGETLDGQRVRVFSGQARWSSGKSSGEWTVAVDAVMRLPKRVSFSGQCEAIDCSMTQLMTYDPDLLVEPPSELIETNAAQVYKVFADGKLEWRQNKDVFVGGSLINLHTMTSISFKTAKQIIPVLGSPVVYTMSPNGDLFWHRHDGYRDGTDTWTHKAARVGNGWNTFTTIIAAEDGVIYARYPDGRLAWYRHKGQSDGTDDWEGPKIVAEANAGWKDLTTIFAGSDGVLYGIKPNGELIWRKHVGHADGTDGWKYGSERVGEGWQNIKAVIPVGRGLLYLVSPNDELQWAQHVGAADGSYLWRGPITIDRNWTNFKFAFAVFTRK